MIEIIKASAGSGKTYTLAVKYIEYLMRAESNFLVHGKGWVKNTHRRTLAITFTNNSTNEMKQRIVEALYEMSNEGLQDYVDRVRQAVGHEVTEERIRKAAGLLLQDMLEDWQMVRVSTIDSFFNQVVNAFIRELGIDQTPAVDLDTDAIVAQAVDNMLNRLEESSPEGKALVRFLDSMMNESISEGRKWNVRPALVKIAKFTLTDTYREYATEDGTSATPERTEALKMSLRTRINELRSAADSIWNEMNARISNIDGAKANCVNATAKHDTKSKTLMKCLDDDSAWFNKKNSASADDGPWLTAKLGEVMAIECGEELNTCNAILASINYTGVIAGLDREIAEVCRENDSILISSTNNLINQIVSNSTTPFIYEKTGLGTDHYMIDEFQDTSVKQWENFVPLFAESNSMDHESLVVGDVKQSIYRWRNGDWRILQHGINQAFPNDCHCTELDTNFRSSKGIVDFNNTLYNNIAQRFADVIGSNLPLIYGSVRQNCAKADKGDGKVSILFAEGNKDEFQQFAMQRIISWFKDLKAKEKQCGDDLKPETYAVLVRKNDEAQFAARALADAGIRFVSAESLLVANDICVKYVIAAMQYALSNGNALATKRLMSLQRCVSDSSEIDTELIDSLRWLPLDQMTMAVVRRYHMETMDNNAHRTFVYTLADIIRNWVRNNDGNTSRWLEYWDEKSKTACVPLPADDNAVRIMTIHKSKGLQFTNVALLMNNTSWLCGINSRHDKMVSVETPQDLSAHDIKRVFVDIFSKDIKGSAYQDLQTSEWEDCCIDELNTLYVATTRAERNMLIVGNKTGKKDFSHNTNFCMVDLLDESLTGWGEDMILDVEQPTGNDVAAEPTGAQPRNHGDSVELGNLPGMMNVRVPKSEEQEEGIEKHAWLATICYEDEVGTMTDEQRQLWDKVRSRGWFSRTWEKVWNEAELAYHGRTLRPDRIMFRGREAVVVDWKFGQKNDKYTTQVRDYCNALKALGYNVTGHIYYATSDETESV